MLQMIIFISAPMLFSGVEWMNQTAGPCMILDKIWYEDDTAISFTDSEYAIMIKYIEMQE